MSSTPTIDDQRQFWNSHWRSAEERRVLNPWTERRALTIVQTIQDLPIERPAILDCGCGHGWFTERLADANPGEVWGIDLSPDAIAMAKSRRPHIRYTAGDVCQSSLPNSYFDVVVSQEVIAHVENQHNYIERVSRLLKPGGYLVITTGNKFVMDRLGNVGWNQYPSEHIENELSSTQMKRLLRPYFKILRFRTIIPQGTKGILRIVNSYRLASLLTPLLGRKRLDELKERAGFGWQMVVLAQKKAVD
jgi:2-polyprenyl-3-methyl-5-hydroxy-6-metoxy-1,4-benzoquinol methylase